MAKEKTLSKSRSRAELQAPAILAGLVRYISTEIPEFKEAVQAQRIVKNYHVQNNQIELSLVFLQNHNQSIPDIDNQVLELVKKFLLETKQLELISSVTINLAHEVL